MRHRLEFVIEEQLWQHEEETEGVDPIDSGLDCPGVPALVGRVQQTAQERSYKLACDTC